MLFVILAVILLLIVFGALYLVALFREINETNQKIAWAEKRHYTLLRIMVPRNNSKSPLAAEQMFAALHGIYRKADVMQEHFSIEIAATGQSINFYMLVPTHLRDFIEGQVYSQYPTVEIEATSDYANVSLEDKHLYGADITLTKMDYYPIRTFTNFDVDPLAGITGVLSKVDDGELLAIQAVMSPINDAWQKEGLDYVKKIKEGKSVKAPPPIHKEVQKHLSSFAKDIAMDVLTGMFSSGKKEAKKEEKKEVKLSGPEEAALKGIESKVTKLGYAVSIRVIAITNNPVLSETRGESVVGAFKQFNLNNLNGFDIGKAHTDASFLRNYRSRSLGDKLFRMNVEEIASVFHFPDTSVETPTISWAGSKKGEPPQNLPIEGQVDPELLTTFGLTSFRNQRTKFGIKALDRMLHFYIIGKTGTGKSTLIENMIYDDIKEGRGVAVVDPHGELIDHILNFIPEERIKDVVYFNPDDREHPLAFNLLENVDEDMQSIVASGLMSIFTKLWANVWSARMEYILRNAILAALAVPNATLLSIMRILNDPAYRKYALSYVTDPVVKDFFFNEYDKYDAKFRQEAIAPIQNKVGQFLSSSTIRNLVGQPKSTFNVSEVMDSGKIFLVNLSIGRIGEDNSKLLGSMMITKIQLAAMGRARLQASERRPFYLYVDEFQNFATDSFATILSEARKYNLGLTLVNQYIAQIPEVVADAIFGNVGSMVSFRVGPEDADRLVKQFAPVFEANDLINLPNRQIYVKMAIDGVTSQAFSAHTLPPRAVATDNVEAIIAASREKYSRPRAEVEKEISEAAQSTFQSEGDRAYDMIRQMRPLLLDGTMYKEFSAKGGDRWYFGQPPEILEEELRKIEAEKLGIPYEEPTKGEEVTPAVATESAVMPADETALTPAAPNEHVLAQREEHSALSTHTADTTAIVPVHPDTQLIQEDKGPKKKKRRRKRKKKSRDGQSLELQAAHTVPSQPMLHVHDGGEVSVAEWSEEEPVVHDHASYPDTHAHEHHAEFAANSVPQQEVGEGSVASREASPSEHHMPPSHGAQPTSQQSDWQPLDEI